MSRSHTSRRARAALVVLLAGYAAFVLVASTPRSPVRPPTPQGAGVPSWLAAISRWMTLDRLSWGGLTVVALLILAGLIAAFAVVCAESWRGRIGIVPVVAVGIVSLGVLTAGPLILSRDVYSYASYGRIYAVHDSNPYETTPARFPDDPFASVLSEEWRDSPSVYGPAFTLLSAGMAGIARDATGATVWAFKVMAAIAVVGAVSLAGLAVRVVRPGREAFAAAVIGLNPLVVVHVVGAGHNDALVALLLAAALFVAVAVRRSPEEPVRSITAVPAPGFWRTSAVTALITLAALVKVVAAVPLVLWIGYLVWSSRPMDRLRLEAGQLGVAAAVTLALTAPLFAGWQTIKALGNLASREGWASGARLVARGFEALIGTESRSSADAAVTAGIYVVFGFVFAWLAWSLFRATDGSPAETWGGGLLLLALAAPYLLPWYLVWVVLFVPFMMELGLGSIALAAAGLLALTGVPAEPGPEPALWRNMVLVVHYVVAPATLALLFVAAVRVKRLRQSRTHQTGLA